MASELYIFLWSRAFVHGFAFVHICAARGWKKQRGPVLPLMYRGDLLFLVLSCKPESWKRRRDEGAKKDGNPKCGLD